MRFRIQDFYGLFLYPNSNNQQKKSSVSASLEDSWDISNHGEQVQQINVLKHRISRAYIEPGKAIHTFAAEQDPAIAIQRIQPYPKKKRYLVAVDINHPMVDLFQKESLQPIFFSSHIFQIIRVNNPYNQAEFGFPPLPMMVPCKMFRLLKDSNVCLLIRDDFCNVSSSQNASFLSIKLQGYQNKQ